MKRFYYVGDVNIEHGGYFVHQSDDGRRHGYADVVRVTPCSDAGGPNNCFWVETLTVNIRDRRSDDYRRALDCIGCDLSELPTRAARRRAVIDAHIAYGFYDITQSECVQIGRVQDECREDSVTPDTVLRGNASLERYARRICSEV